MHVHWYLKDYLPLFIANGVTGVNRTWQCPTLTVLRNTAFLDDPVLQSDPRLKYMPSSTRNLWDPTKDSRFKERTAEDWELARLVFKKQVEVVGAMRRAGVEFLAGTDVLNPYCFPGQVLEMCGVSYCQCWRKP